MRRGELFAFGYTTAYLGFSVPAVAAGYSIGVVAVGIAALSAQLATHRETPTIQAGCAGRAEHCAARTDRSDGD